MAFIFLSAAWCSPVKLRYDLCFMVNYLMQGNWRNLRAVQNSCDSLIVYHYKINGLKSI